MLINCRLLFFILCSCIMIQCGCHVRKHREEPGEPPKIVSESFAYLKDLERNALKNVDIVECPDKHPDWVDMGEVNGRISYFKSIIDSAGYVAEWDCKKETYSLRKRTIAK